MKIADLQYWLAIHRIPSIGSRTILKLSSAFPNMQSVWQDTTESDLTTAGLTTRQAQTIIEYRTSIIPEELETELRQHNVNALPITSPAYPELLKTVFDPPAVLYYRGSLHALEQSTIAVVGTRKMTSYGRLALETLLPNLSGHPVTIVSGLALGIDAHAHYLSVQQGLPTVAVLGSGVNNTHIFPATNRRLAEKIIQQEGLVISEYPINTMPTKHNFPMRNRIIAGLSQATLVIEAGASSGALITAQYALDNSREVFAIPGNITNHYSQGTNRLIKEGAHTITSADDIISLLTLAEMKQTTAVAYEPTDKTEKKIIQLLQSEPRHIDIIVKETKLPAATVSAKLAILELQGHIKNIGNMTYSTVST